MSLVTRLQQLAARLLVEVAQRQPVDLVLDVGAHPADGVLHDAVEHVALQPAPAATRRRTPRARAAARAPTAAKSTPWPGTTCPSAASMSASLSSPAGRGAPRPRCGLGRPGGHARPNSPAKIRSVAWPRIRGPSDDQRDADDGEHARPRSALPRSGRIRRDAAAWPTGRRPSPSGRPCRRPSGRGPGPARRWMRSVSFSRPVAGAGSVRRWCSCRSCRLLRGQLGRDDLLVGRAASRAARRGCRGRRPRRPRARGSGRRR